MSSCRAPFRRWSRLARATVCECRSATLGRLQSISPAEGDMALDSRLQSELAERLDRAEETREPIGKLTDDYPDLSWDDAYAIQAALRARKEARGVRIVG